ncbi:uncharacterized protein LOC134240674 [Saccostrea cucullata]|uniref:uncharacterized protein LOC134240674 n=1 Tax=Saccostrea cuccullata TaxID=36930 RepID=UPI002ED5C527
MISIHRFLQLLSILWTAIIFTEGTLTVTYEFGEDCSVSLDDVSENRQIYVEYKGEKVSTWCDYMSFNGRGYNILDEYEICVTPIYFNDPYCSVRLDYKSSYGGRTLQSVSCGENVYKKFCGSQDDYMYIFFEKRGRKSTQNAKFKLHITATKVFDYKKNKKNLVGAIVGGIVGGCVFIGLLIGCCCWCACKRKSSQGQVLVPTQENAVPMVNQSTYHYPSYNAQNPSGNTTVYPPGNYATQYTPQYNTQTQYNSQPQYNTQTEYNTQPQYNTQPEYNTQPQYNPQPQYNTETPNQSSETSRWHEPDKSPSAPPPSYDEVAYK